MFLLCVAILLYGTSVSKDFMYTLNLLSDGLRLFFWVAEPLLSDFWLPFCRLTSFPWMVEREDFELLLARILLPLKLGDIMMVPWSTLS